MKRALFCVLACFACLVTRQALAQEPVTIPVDSPAFVFSPANWVGDADRGGGGFRQTWYPGAYCRVTWESDATADTPTLLFNTSTPTTTAARRVVSPSSRSPPTPRIARSRRGGRGTASGTGPAPGGRKGAVTGGISSVARSTVEPAPPGPAPGATTS